MSVVLDLPALTSDEAEHSARLEERIRGEIAGAGGWIGFGRFMQMALYEPGLGYYSAGARKLGAAGDFVTAPEVAPVFSRCLAVQCAEILAGMGGGEILELGAGSGAMAAAMLGELERQGDLPGRFLILDVSADLRERQRTTLGEAVPHLLGRIEWLDRLPERFEGVVVANEVLDAMPVERFVVRGGAVYALGVGMHEGRFEWSEVPAPAELQRSVLGIAAGIGAEWPEGYASEVNVGLAPWVATMAATLARGVMLFVDYGLPRREYYSPERRTGTLLCHFRHRFHEDPFARVGLQDITAWVDFTAVAEAALAAGLDVVGYATQAHFLLGNDLGRFVTDAPEGTVPRVELSRQAMMLTLPGETGERFKVIALAKGYAAPLRGFALRDLRHTL